MKTFIKQSSGVITSLLLLVGSLAGPTPVYAATAINFGDASSFAVLAGTPFIANTGSSVITGNVGLSPATGAGITGFPPGSVVGTIYTVDAGGPAGSVANPALLTLAKNALTAAYIDAAGQTPVATIGSELGGATLTAGVYDSADTEFHVTGTLTLDGQNNPNAVFIFKAGSTLTTANASIVSLINGAQACNVYWQIGSSAATLGTNSTFKGNLMSLTSITLTTGANVEGRVLARNGAVTLDSNVITVPTCTVASPPTSQPATINVVKTVINDNGGTKVVADFPLFVNGGLVVSGVTNTFPAPALLYHVTETGNAGYKQTFSGDCDPFGGVSLNSGNNKFCIITNDDIGAPVVVPPVPPLIDVVKVPNPLALPLGPGPVTYTYTLRNIGTVPVTNVTMVGDTCSPIVLVSGDTNSDAKLDVNEVWVHRCTTTLSATHTNTVVATGWANGLSAVDIASATVVVGAPVPPPLIHIIKKPSAFVLPVSGLVTYTYTVSNPGAVALNNVVVTDDKCSPVGGRTGDTNSNNLLDLAETWTYTCRMQVTANTVNTAKAVGTANGITATDFSIVTVLVTTPALPATGIAPEESGVSGGWALATGIVAAALLSYGVRRKQTA